MNAPRAPDWDAAESVLLEECRKAVDDFSMKHRDEICAFFALSIDYSFGDVSICFDTLDNSLLHAKRHQQRTLKTWDAAFAGPRGWQRAKQYIERNKLCGYGQHTAEFKYPSFATMHLSDWEEYFGSERLSEHPDPVGHVIVLVHRVVNKLVSFNSFTKLAMSSPFRVGVEFPRDEFGLVIMQLLHWPPHEGPRV